MHKIEIPDEILQACIRRRGSVHVFDRIDVARTALVVIDMQNSWVEPGAALEIPAARSIVDNINGLAAALRGRGGRVAWTQSTFEPTWTRSFYEGFARPEWIERSIAETSPEHRGFDIYAGMDVDPADIISVKNRPSALVQGSSDLDRRLREASIDTLVITGTLTNACCESTARDAAALGYRILFASDGTATRSDIEHNAALINLMQLVADVRTCEEIRELVRRSSE